MEISIFSSDSDDSDLDVLAQLSDWDADSDAEDRHRASSRKIRRVNYMQSLDDADFTFRFRLSKPAFTSLLMKLMPFICVTSARNNGVSPLHQLLLTLRFYALGTMLISVADFVGVSISTAGRIVHDIKSAIANLYDKYILVHQQSAEKFYCIEGFPRVLAAIDCTHIRNQSPCHVIGEEFRNRKVYFSLNVQVISDTDLTFMNVIAHWPGSIHDATIFNNSILRAQCDAGLFGNRWMLGDSAYPNRPYLLTPIINPATEAEQRYNEAHIKTRNVIERQLLCLCLTSIRYFIFSRKGEGCYIALGLWSLTGHGAHAASPVGPSDRPEAYFNGSSYIRLSRPISLKQLVGLSFRTCVGGELFSQRFEGYTLHMTALFEQVVVSWARPGQPQREVGLARETLDNHWHWVALRYRPEPLSLLLEVDKDTQVIANVTWNPELLSPGALEAGGAVLLVGNLFSGCIHEGPQLEFHAANMQHRNVTFGNCPLTTDDCIDRKDVLRIPPKDHCYNEPCMRHGTCISRHDRYECHCSARYTGNNCEVDAGEPCASAPCQHAGRCVEDARGDYTCLCAPGYHGTYCELEVSLDPQCVAGPCRNNASCRVPPGADSYVCDCPPGFTGRDCEVDVDECAGAGALACLHGGRCLDAVNNYTCDCTHTGYTGPRCSVNVNECEEDRLVCGHGACYDTYGGYVCACLPGYTGDHCQQMSACASGPCGAGGACVEEDGGAGYRCVCARGWAPPHCDVPLPAPPVAPPATPAAPPAAACADLQCPPHSHCRDAHSLGLPGMVAGVMVTKQVICVCDLGYYGAPGRSPNCSRAESACEAGVCLHGATCTRLHDRPLCTCAPGYTGAYCELPVGAGGAEGAGAGGTGGAAGKALSELKAEHCSSAPCVHAVACRDLAGGFRCECEVGWAGVRCDIADADPEAEEEAGAATGAEAEDCRTLGCPHHPEQECVEQNGWWRCSGGEEAREAGESGGGEGSAGACASSPCRAGACVSLPAGLFSCRCPPGLTGRLCELDKDECALMPKICNHGVCVNVPGSYQCYCKPGYTGDSCEQDIDECLSSPCKNGGTCQNLENNYECTCMDGFEGKDCSININECESNPCAAGSTCVDGIASYSCVCQEGLTGANCEIDIDDCESQPCQHGGRCTDALGGFTCSCAGTGYAGATCELDVDECASQPCRHGGTCLDELNDYRCACHPGYTGKNCEVDVNECESSPCQFGGVCLERSNASLYQEAGAPPLLVGPQPHMLLPASFYQPFSLDAASGYECVCVAGTAGARCEVNVDECASSPCRHGKCLDAVGGYTCLCAPGYEGQHCDLEIDECQRYAPCAHGRCVDLRAAYLCVCDAGWGGRNCSVLLQGCRRQPCRHNATCLPWLYRETEHRFNCSCTPGHYGTTCEKITTMSLENSSYAEVNTSREEGYDLSFRFKTTLGHGLLAMGRGLTYFFLELSSGRLNLHSSLLNKWEGVFIGSNLNDSNWQKVFVTINSSHLVLAANEEQTIYPISQNEAFNASVTSFPSTRLGTAGSSYATLTHGPNYFVGCFQDVVVNGQWVLPEDSNTTSAEAAGGEEEEEEDEEVEEGGDAGSVAAAELHGVAAACPRVAQCSPNPCRWGGLCEDAWSRFICTCARPHLGATCQHTYAPATFAHEAARARSTVRVRVAPHARRAVLAALHISMFIRTRKPTGQIFYLGSGPRFGQTDETLVGASLNGGELLLHLRFNQTPENYTVGGTRLDNGYMHLIEVVRNSTLVQVKLNGTEYFRKSISAARQLDAQVLYLGGPPPLEEVSALPVPAALSSPASPASPLPGSPASPASPIPASPVPASPVPAAASSIPAGAPVDPAYPAAPLSPLSPMPPALESSTPESTTQAQPHDDPDYFKGVIQDVQVSNGAQVWVVEFFPLVAEGLQLPPSFGEVSFDPEGVLQGVVSDDVCASQPCLHNATCTNTWNDYTCLCPRGYKGKQCAEVEFCQLQGCPLNSHCRNLDGGYECVSNATFDGVSTALSYRLRAPSAFLAQDAAPRPPSPASLTITYRSKSGGTLFHAELNEWWFSVGVYKEQVTVQWRLGGGLPALRRMRTRRDHLQWGTLRLRLADGQVAGAFVESEGEEEVGFTASIDVEAWQRLMLEGELQLGGLRRPRGAATATTAATATSVATAAATSSTLAAVENSTETVWEYSEGDDFISDNLSGEYFKGCMGAVHVGELLLPFFSEEELFVGATASLLARQPYYALLSGRPWGASQGVGCVLCLEQDCQRGGHCTDLRSSYACTCPPGYAGDYCEIDVDECESNQCQNGATCKDGVAMYTCICPEGFEGELCSMDVDECVSSPCANGGTCSNVAGGFVCTCAAEWRGARCQLPRERTCAHAPCAPARAACRDQPPDRPTGNNYTCDCFEGYEGVHCEFAFCELEPCVHGTCVIDANPPQCACAEGYSGRLCEAARDACADAGAAACLHGGRCLDRRGHFLCDCTNTGWTGARCETDVDECGAALVNCGPGRCRNLPGSYTCECSPGYCGDECKLPDPCYEVVVRDDGTDAADVADPDLPQSNATEPTGPCQNGARCEQRCSSRVDYVCHCVDGWAGKNCTQQAVGGAAASGGGAGHAALGAGLALAALALAAAGGAALAAQARRKRATRGTYSPSGQEYCNPRAEMMHHALKPPPEERLI